MNIIFVYFHSIKKTKMDKQQVLCGNEIGAPTVGFDIHHFEYLLR